MPANQKTDLLKRATRAIENTLADPQIQELVAPHACPPEKLAEGRKLLDVALAADSAQRAAEAELQRATVIHNKAMRAARSAYRLLVKVARASCDKRALRSLGLSRAEPEDSGTLMLAARRLFDNSAYIPDLTRCGYNAEKLAAGRASVQALMDARGTLIIANNAAHQAEIKQKSAFKFLDIWLGFYTAMAKMALYSHPKLLKKLGMPTPADDKKAAAERAARRKATAAWK